MNRFDWQDRELIRRYNELDEDIEALLDKANVEPSTTLLDMQEELFREILENAQAQRDYDYETHNSIYVIEDILRAWGVSEWKGPLSVINEYK